MNRKWMEDWNMGPETVKLLEENGEKLPDIDVNNDFVHMTPAQGRKQESMNGRHQTQRSCAEAGTIDAMKRHCRMGENIRKPSIW